MKKIILSLLLASASYSVMAERSPTAEEFAQQVQDYGAAKVISGIPETDDGLWNEIFKHISNGEAAWLKLIPSISMTGAVSWNEQLGTALAQAIPKNVNGVMEVIDDSNISISTASVCSMPLYHETVPEQNEYVVKAIQALYKSNSVQAQKCLQQLIMTVGQSSQFREVD